MIGVKTTNALVALIYKKQLKISNASNQKKFSQGEIVNFIQTDAEKIKTLNEYLTYVIRYPLTIVVCFTLLFLYIHLSFLAGVAVFLLAFIVNIILSQITARL